MLTDNEIIKAYACCNIQEYGGCEECPCKQDGECIIPSKGFELEKAVCDVFNRLQAENKQLQSDVITANQNLEHFKELWEADKAKEKETISKYIDKHSELIHREKEIQNEGAKAFAKFLIDKAMHGVIPIDAIPTLVKEWVGENND